MSFEEDFVQYDALRSELFFAPPPQHTDAPSCESFDQDVAELDLDLPFQQIDDFFRAFVPIIPSSPSTLTYSTDSFDEVASSSLYTSDLSQSDYSILSEIDSYYSLNNGIDGTHDSIHPAVFSNGPPSIPPFHSAEAQFDFDFGTSDLSPNVEISQEDLSSALQPPSTSVVPAPLPVYATPDSEAQKAPTTDKPFKCPFCHHSSDRSYNLKTHMGIHYNLKPFNCDDCGRGFTRKNDLDRHRQNPRIHRKQSAYPDSTM